MGQQVDMWKWPQVVVPRGAQVTWRRPDPDNCAWFRPRVVPATGR